ncbi:MAG: MMPL family transporter [Desulfobacula sp.]|nr:MMPL family transporter [Desulfobacula sp.]
MSSIRNKIETLFESFAYSLFDNKYKIFIFMLLVIVLLASRIPGITIDTSTEGFLHKNDSILLDYEAFRDQFGRDEMAIVAIEPEKVFDLKFLEKLKALHQDLNDNLPYLDDITSLVNARNTYGNKDELIVEDLLEHWPENEKELAAIEKKAMANQMYKNLLLSENGRLTTIVIKTLTYSGKKQSLDDDLSGFVNDDASEQNIGGQKAGYLTDKENSEFVTALEKIIDRHRTREFPVFIAGTPVVTDFLKRSMITNMRKFMGIALVTIAIFLFVMFRRLSGVFMPIFIVIVSLVSTLGLMSLSGVSIKIPTQILPSFLLSVAIGASVHVLVMFFQSFDKQYSKRDSIARALGHSGLAIVMTSLTTAGGLMSFSTAAVAPIADLGVFASAGIILSLIYTIVFLPVLLAILPIKSKNISDNEKLCDPLKKLMDNLLNGCIHISTHYPKKVLFVSFILALAALAGSIRIELSHDPVRWLPHKSNVRLANEKLDIALKGTTSLEVILDTKKENGLYEPNLLLKLENSSKEIENYKDKKVYVGKAWSITSVLKETNQALHENKAKYYIIPESRDLIAQELFLFENSGSDDLEDFTDTQFSKARFTIKVPFVDAIAYAQFMDKVTRHFKENYPRQNIKITGMVAMLARVITNAIHSMIKSYGYALIIITVLMIFLIGKVKIGVFSMIPNIFPIIIMLGVMGWCNIPMDLFCMMVGSIAIGLAVDDTIHFMHNFRRYYEIYHDAEKAVYETLHTTGRAMLVTTCVLSIGFFTFMFSEMNNLINFGFLTGFTLLMALLADYFIAPSLMVLLNKKPYQDSK